MRPRSTLSETDSESTMSSAFSDDDNYDDRPIHNNNSSRGITTTSNNSNNSNNASSSQQFFAKLVRDTRSKVEQKTLEINATMQEKLPEWKQKGAMYSNKAKETSIEWSRKGKEAVDRWKKEHTSEEGGSHSPTATTYQRQQEQSENSVFGMPLEVAVALTSIDKDDLIPAVFRRCIEYLDKVGVHEVGIYRIPGSTTTVNKLRDVFNEGLDIDFDTTQPDPHAVGTLLKMYLRELPEPIIPYQLINEYTEQFKKFTEETSGVQEKDALVDTIKSEIISAQPLPPMSSSLLKTVRLITTRLPIYSFCLLQLLCRHLKKVADNQDENRMSVSNLAVIFIPTLNISRALFHCMVEHYCDIFENSKPSAGPVTSNRRTSTIVIPPPLPQKPHNLTVDLRNSKQTVAVIGSIPKHKNTSLPLLSTDAATNESIQQRKKTLHSKTMSDTQILSMNNDGKKDAFIVSYPSIQPPILSPNNRNTNSSSSSNRSPPPKPSRASMIQKQSASESSSPQKQKHSSIPFNNNAASTAPPVKPRSKSVSSSFNQAMKSKNDVQQQNENERMFWKRSGRVEAIGRQFETLMSNNNSKNGSINSEHSSPASISSCSNKK